MYVEEEYLYEYIEDEPRRWVREKLYRERHRPRALYHVQVLERWMDIRIIINRWIGVFVCAYRYLYVKMRGDGKGLGT